MRHKKLRLKKAWGTHMPMVIKIVQMTDGPVLELGSGPFSTPLLHWLCKEKERLLVTYEHDPVYHAFAKEFRSTHHKARLIEDWDTLDTTEHWSVILVDHDADRRAKDIIRLKDSADYIIIHDTDSAEYGYDTVWKHFKHRYDWKECRPWTTVVSNTIDVKKICE